MSARIQKTFYDWCIENDANLLLLWDTKLNNKSPKDISYRTHCKCWFLCEKGIHKSEQKWIDKITTRGYGSGCRQCHSFGQWIVDNFGQEYIDKIWDEELNSCSPFDVHKNTKQKYYIKCQRGLHKSNKMVIASIVSCGSIKCSKCSSVGQWMIDNLGDNAIDKYWSDKNKMSPYTVNQWCDETIFIKCINPTHKDYPITAKRYVSGGKCPECSPYKEIVGSAILCNQRPDLVKYFVDKSESQIYAVNSGHESDFACPYCGYSKKMKISTLSTEGFFCPNCSDGVSYPNKFMFSCLKQIASILGYKDYSLFFAREKTFDWAITNVGKRYYDFFVNTEDPIIIECHGLQHYQNTGFGGRSLLEEQENDLLKSDMALNNGIHKDRYIVLDCRVSTMEFIKNSIYESNLLQLFGISFDEIDWGMCEQECCNSLVQEVCKSWNNGVVSIQQLSHIFNLDRSTVRRYLKKGHNASWCKYSPVTGTQLQCVENNYIFSSMAICSKTSRDIFGTFISLYLLRRCLANENIDAKGYHFKTIDKDDFCRIQNTHPELCIT